MKYFQPNPEYRLLAENSFAMRRLAWPLAISLLLHAAVISLLDWNRLPAPTGNRHTLTVNLEPAPSIRRAISPDDNPPPARTIIEEPSEKEARREKILPPAKGVEIPATENKSTPATHLDMNNLLKQASAYAKTELRTTPPAFTLNGDYYGTYSGSDNGTFYVHLDNAGHASGTGQSGSYGISFVITGEAARDGLIQMSGSGIAGNARFRGQLDIKSGKLSGTWLAAGIGSGSFAGQHE